MVLFNYSTKEITAKIVYYGPGLCGKTTNLQFIYDNLPGNIQRGRMLSLATKTDRTLFFDFLPIDLGMIRGMRTRVQLYTVPGQVFYNSTRKLVLKGADGIVFVADSQEKMAEANLESFRNLEENCVENSIKLSETPLVLQFNKRDLPGISSVEEMNNLINKYNAPFYESVATTGIGVHETLKAITKLVLHSLREKYAGEREGAARRPAAGPAPAEPAFAAPPQPVAPPAAVVPPLTPVPPVAPPAPPAFVAPAAVAAAPPPPAQVEEEPLVLEEEGEEEVALPASLAGTVPAEPAAAEWGAGLGGSSLEAAFADLDEEAEAVPLEAIDLEEEAPALMPLSAEEPTVEPPLVEGLLTLAEPSPAAVPAADETFADLAAELSEPAAEEPIPLAAEPEAEPIPLASPGWEVAEEAPPRAAAPWAAPVAAAPLAAEDDILGLAAPPAPAAPALGEPRLAADGRPLEIPLQIEVDGTLRRYRLRVTLEPEA